MSEKDLVVGRIERITTDAAVAPMSKLLGTVAHSADTFVHIGETCECLYHVLEHRAVAAEALLREIVAKEPTEEYDDCFETCVYCEGTDGGPRGGDDVVHLPSCPWVRAREFIRGFPDVP